jgi:hypothetical protein
MTTTPQDPEPAGPDEQPDVVPSHDPEQPWADPQTQPAPEPEGP